MSKMVRLGIEFTENLIKRGRYSPEAMLQDDGSFATQAAQDYVRVLANYRPTVFIVRECQNIDPESLRFFLTIGDETMHTAVIFEYTTYNNHFSPDHEKIILEAVAARNTLRIFDLMRLDLKEFRLLLRKYVPLDKKIEVAVELAWDGNLRIIKELKYRLMVGHSADLSSPLLLPEALDLNMKLL